MSFARAVPVLMYHHVSPNPGLVTVSPGTFAAQMAYLAAAGYTTLGADEFLEFLRGERQVPKKSVLITFDDGYLDNYVHAYPVLRRLGLHAVIFAVTGWIGEGPARAGQILPCLVHRACKAAIAAGHADDVMVRWSEIEEMEASGAVEVHSHTHTHTRWDKEITDPVLRLEKMAEELRQSKEVLKSRLGRDSRHLCWPQGYFEPGYQALARESGFAAQYTVDKGVNVVGGDTERIARIVVKDRAGPWFARRLRIFSHPWLGSLYARLRGA